MPKDFSLKRNRLEDVTRMRPHTARRSDPLTEEIRRQIGSSGVKRYLASLPPFAVEPGLPDHFRKLLGDLESAEIRGQGSGARRRN